MDESKRRLVILGYLFGGAFTIAALAWIGFELHEQGLVAEDMRVLREGGTPQDIRAAQEDLARRRALEYLIAYLDTPAHLDERMRISGAFKRFLTGYSERISKRQEKALVAMMDGEISMPESLDLSPLYPKLEQFREGENVILDETEEQLMETACEILRADYDRMLSYAVEALKLTAFRMIETPKGIRPVHIGEISRLLGRESPDVREGVGEIMIALGPDSYKWLKKLLERTVHKVQAQETAEYDEYEREAQLNEQNDRAKREAVRILLKFDTPEAREIIRWAETEPALKGIVDDALAMADAATLQ